MRTHEQGRSFIVKASDCDVLGNSQAPCRQFAHGWSPQSIEGAADRIEGSAPFQKLTKLRTARCSLVVRGFNDEVFIYRGTRTGQDIAVGLLRSRMKSS